MSDKLLPWQEDSWSRLLARRRAGSLPHALLLTGPAGIGKTRFAEAWMRGLLCERPRADGLACGGCRACGLLAAGSHPDYRWLRPPEDGNAIGIDQVRELIHYAALTPQYGAHKLVAIEPADKFTANAANSLLKTLEEPPPHSLLLLLTAQPARLPVTVTSRCQRVHFAPPPAAQGIAWLAEQAPAAAAPELLLRLADGGPLRALALAEADALRGRATLFDLVERLGRGEAEPVAAAETALKLGVQETLYCLYSWTCDMIRLVSGGPAARVVNDDLATRLRTMAAGMGPQALFRRLDALTQALQWAERPLNAQLLLEDILLGWRGTVDRGRG